MIPRILEPEAMDTPEDAADYDAMDHSAVNQQFAADFLSAYRGDGPVLDVGTGTARIPIAVCGMYLGIRIVAVDLAEHMLAVARRVVAEAGLADRITLQQINARGMPFPDGHFPAVMSNSIIHHIPEPHDCLVEMSRVCAPGGVIFVRDLHRPESRERIAELVNLHAADANDHQRALFADSLHAALTLAEVRALVAGLGFSEDGVTMTSDRHWTWIGRKRAR